MRVLFKVFLSSIALLGVLFLLMFIATAGDYSVPKTVSTDPTISHVTINGVTFHSETFGDPENPVVIIVHGGPGWDYKSLLPLKTLADEFYVVFYDQRGTGLSPRVEQEALTLASYLQDLDAIIDYYRKDKKVRLVGHSWGAMLVSAYIGQNPEKLSHAVLAEPGFLTTDMVKEAGISFGPEMDAGFLFFATTVWFQSLRVNGPDEHAAADYFLGQVAPQANPEYYCNGIVPEAGVEHWRASAASMQNVMNLMTNAEGSVDIDLIEGVDVFTDTVLFIAAECNEKIGVAHQKKLMTFFPNAELAIIKESGHMMFGEKPDESVSVVREYLQR